MKVILKRSSELVDLRPETQTKVAVSQAVFALRVYPRLVSYYLLTLSAWTICIQLSLKVRTSSLVGNEANETSLSSTLFCLI